MQLCCTPRRLQLFTCIVGAASIVTVLVILFLSNWPTFARKKLLNAVIFKNDSMEIERFRTTADLVNLRLEIFVYNVTNSNEVINGSAKINLQQLGPFVYLEYKEKEFLNNNQTSGLIEYKLRKRYIFRPDLSVGDPKKLKITWLNVPLLAAKSYLDQLSFLKRRFAYIAFNQAIRSMSEPAFITDTIENLIFAGSKRELFVYLQSLDIFKMFQPWPLPDNKFALLYNKNFTWIAGRDHVFTMSAGFGEGQTYRNLNQYIYMDGSSKLPFWRETPSQCNKLGGTDGEFFSPFLNSSTNLEAYSSDICRKLSLKYRNRAIIDGIEIYRYTLDERSLQSGLKNPENDCYCLERDSNNATLPECDLDGLIDLSKCVAPNVVASGVHFLYGSPTLRQRISGLPMANISQDEPVVYVEPNTGLTVQTRVPLQINVRLEKHGFKIFNWFKDDQPLIVPVFHVIEAAEMTEDQSALLHSKLLMLDSWLVSMVLGGTIVFIIAIIAAAVVICTKLKSPRSIESNERDPLIPSTSADSEENIARSPQWGSNYQSI